MKKKVCLPQKQNAVLASNFIAHMISYDSVQKFVITAIIGNKAIFFIIAAVVVISFFVCWAPFHAQRLGYVYFKQYPIFRQGLLFSTFLW